MRDYQRKKHTSYTLPKTVYNETLWKIRDYYRMKEIAEAILDATSNSNGTCNTNNVSDKVANVAAKRERFLAYIRTIERALQQIPPEYRDGVWNNIQNRTPYPHYAGRATFGRYKAKFIYLVAEAFEII